MQNILHSSKMLNKVDRLDIIIFGATGFTGKRTIPQLSKLIQSENLSLTWGVAGRTEQKLKKALSEIEQKIGEDYSNIPLICADVNEIESLEKMTAQARIIINAVGPYRFLGERVIQACIKTATHHVDVSGEPQYMETMQLKYHEIAKEKGIYLVSACGFDSIPADLGAIFLQKNFEGTLNSIETYLYTQLDGGSYSGARLHYTTYESAVYGLTYYNELREIRSKLFPKRLPEFEPKLFSKGAVFKSKLLNKWCTIFPGADRSVMLRTQRYLYEEHNQRPAQVQSYCCYPSILHLLLVLIFGAIFVVMCKFNFTRNLLLKHPKLFTCGLASHEGPSDEVQENTHFYVFLHGEGWNEKLKAPTDQYNTPPNKTITAKISGKNPGYGSTCIALALAAIITLTENDKMPNGGGCYPPGAAFANTSIIEKLNKHGVKFELNSSL